MSSEAPVGLTIMEKLLGLVIILIGALTFYITYMNMATVGPLPILFLAAGLVLVGLGVFILVARVE